MSKHLATISAAGAEPRGLVDEFAKGYTTTNPAGLHTFFDLDTPGVVFDMSRLVIRKDAAHPTGVDRIDLTFALQATELAGSHFVYVREGVLSMLRPTAARRLVLAIEAAWRAPRTEPTIEIPRLALRHGRTAATVSRGVRAVFWRAMAPLRAAAERSLRADATAALASGTCTYLTTGHHGLARHPALLAGFLGPDPVAVAAYVHDLIPIRYPEFQRPGADRVLARFFGALAKRGARFTANSHATATDLRTWLAEHDHENAVRVRYPPLPQLARLPASPPSTNPPYFVIVGTIEPRKNHLFLLNIWRRMIEDGLTRIPKLLIAGSKGWMNVETRAVIERSAQLAPYVELREGLDDAALFDLMAGARALLFPSFAEGFGLPLIEAQALGVPCIASNIPVFRELASPTIRLLDPTDGLGWRAAIEALSR